MSYHSLLLDKFPIRRSSSQKEAFRAYVQGEARKLGYRYSFHSPKATTTNIILGDPMTASVTFSAHYDTPAHMIFPNLMIPRNLPLFFLYQMLIVCVLLAVALAVGVALNLVLHHVRLSMIGAWLVYMGLLFLMILGPANKHNANDNTSGTAALLELMARIPPEQRQRVAFIFFDNEEKGLVGSKAYAKENLEFQHTHLLVNLDCVGVGEHILFISSALAQNHPAWAQLPAAFEGRTQRQVHFLPKAGSVCNSDQKPFKCSVAVIACKRAPVVGFYCDKIHTGKDTSIDENNLPFLTDGLTDFVSRLS